jgi:hypothetical protein
MNTNNQGNTMIASLLKPVTNKSSSRKVWAVDLETVWLPFFTATNATGSTSIPHEALGAPLRLGTNKDGSVKFGSTGKPVVKIAKELNQAVSMVRENFVAGLQAHAHDVFTNQPELYKAEVAECVKAGKPIAERDSQLLKDALAEQKRQADVEAQKVEQARLDKLTIENALSHADSETANEPDKVLA